MSNNTVTTSQLDNNSAILLVTLNRPDRLNALNTEMGHALIEAMRLGIGDAAIRVIVLTGAGDRAFCVGGDLKERGPMTPAEWVAQHRVFEEAFGQVRRMPKPILAAVNGVAVGGGCELAMSCDFIVCADHASFGQPEVGRGIMPGGGGTQLLPRAISRGLALKMLMTGQSLSAKEARRAGLVTDVVPLADLLPLAARVAGSIAANSPTAVQQAKRSVRLGIDSPEERAIEIELECYQRMVDHPDRYEGIAAFNERREPHFLEA